ncbi:MAG TPA: hypothetical protein VGI70_06085, partial [Polyangiales bacterium]
MSTGAALIAIAGLCHLAYHASYTLDDAYISYRYARNFARGLGLVYNPGEYVKGYSNTLYTLLMSLPELFGKDPNRFSKLLGAGAFIGMLFVFVREYASSAAPPERALTLLLLCAGSSALSVHFMSGLETGLYSALIVAAVQRRLDEQERGGAPWSALLFSLVVLSRPEGILVFAAMLVHDAIWRSFARGWRPRDSLFCALPIAVYAGELLWSLHYYGDALPQTFYAKTRETHGFADALLSLARGLLHQLRPGSYLAKGLDAAGFGIFALAALPIALAARARRRRNAAYVMVALALIVFIARAGDDWAPAFRFGVPLLPCLFLSIVEAVAVVAALFRRHQRLAAGLMTIALLAISLPRQRRDSIAIQAQRYVNAENKLVQGAFFASLAEPGITLSSFDIGGQGYGAAGFDVLDAAGLVTRETVGCPGRAPRICAEYARLVLPQLIRLHHNRRRDGYILKAVAKEAPYLSLDGAKYWIARALIFVPSPAPSSVARGIAIGAETQLVAIDVATALSTRQASAITLYWRRGSTGDANSIERRLAWSGPSGRFDARASRSIRTDLDDRAAWRDSELFADRASIEAPARPGRYRLELVLPNARAELATLDVVEPARANERATALAREAQQLMAAGQPEASLQRFERAVQLSGRVRGEYQRALVAYT